MARVRVTPLHPLSQVNVQMSDLDAPFSDALPVAPWSGPAPAVDVVALLRASKRPVVMLGEGSRGAAASVRALVARLGLPFTCSWAGLDLCGGGGGLFVGPHGVYGARAANFAIQNADLLLVLGARLDTRQTGGNLAAFSRESVKVVVDIDGQETARLAERGLAVTAVTSDVGAFVAHLLARPELPTGELPVAEWRATVAGWGAKYGEEAHPPTAPHACAYSVLRQLDALMPPDAVVAIDTGATLVWCFQTLAPSGSRRIFSNLGNSSMGFSLPAAIGAAIGRPDLPVICIIGDGGAQQNIQELVTVAHYRLNVKVFVFNNSGYGIIKQFQTSYLQGRLVATERGDLYGVAGGVDFSAVAAAYGVPARRVTAEAPLAAEEVTKPGFALFDVVVHESQGIQARVRGGCGYWSSATSTRIAPPQPLTPLPPPPAQDRFRKLAGQHEPVPGLGRRHGGAAPAAGGALRVDQGLKVDSTPGRAARMEAAA